MEKITLLQNGVRLFCTIIIYWKDLGTRIWLPIDFAGVMKSSLSEHVTCQKENSQDWDWFDMYYNDTTIFNNCCLVEKCAWDVQGLHF